MKTSHRDFLNPPALPLCEERLQYDSDSEWNKKSMKLKLRIASVLVLLAAASSLRAQQINSEVARLNKIAVERHDAHDLESAERHYLHALDIAPKSESHDTVATLHQNLGILYATEHRYTDADKQYHLAYDLLKAKYGEQDRKVAFVLDRLGEVSCFEGQFSAAASLFQRALGILRSQERPSDREIATVLANLAAAQWLVGNLSKAEKSLDELTAYFERGGKGQELDLAFALQVRARIAEQQGNLPRAQAHCRQAVSILEGSGKSQGLAAALIIMGQLLLHEQDLQGAQAKLERALQLITSDAAQESPLGAASMSSLARCYHMQGKVREAKPLFERAIGINQRLLGPDHPNLLYAMQDYARFLRATKQKHEAKKLEAYVHDHLGESKDLHAARNVVEVQQLFHEQKH
jgi:tetratricopeptide (TPR) repeat protein